MQIELVSSSTQIKKHNNLRAFEKFCCGLTHPVSTDSDFILASIDIFSYQNGKILKTTAELMFITHGYGFGNILFADSGKRLAHDGVGDLLKNPDRNYGLGRRGTELVIESPDTVGGIVHRIDLIECVSPFTGRRHVH